MIRNHDLTHKDTVRKQNLERNYQGLFEWAMGDKSAREESATHKQGCHRVVRVIQDSFGTPFPVSFVHKPD
jgi:hypothetical protein